MSNDQRDRLLALQQDIERRRSAIDKNKGRVQAAVEELRNLGVEPGEDGDVVKAAETLLQKLARKQSQIEEKVASMLDDLEKDLEGIQHGRN